MPTPWLVTNPPTQSNPNTAIAKRIEKRCNQGLFLLRIMNKPALKKECRCNKRRSGNCCKNSAELLRSHQFETDGLAIAGAESHFLRFGARLEVKRFHRVVPRGNIRDLERTILVRDRVVRIVHHSDISEHPGV